MPARMAMMAITTNSSMSVKGPIFVFFKRWFIPMTIEVVNFDWVDRRKLCTNPYRIDIRIYTIIV